KNRPADGQHHEQLAPGQSGDHRADEAHDALAIGIDIVATVPRGVTRANDNAALSPYSRVKRRRMLARPVPRPSVTVRPCPESATFNTRAACSRTALTRIEPPSIAGSIPCLRAFSTSVNSIIVGTRSAPIASGTKIS